MYKCEPCYRDTGSVAHPRRCGQKMAHELKISQYAIRQILKNELGVKPLKIQKVQDLTEAQKKVRLVRAKELLRLAENGELPNLGFSDEKPFVIQQFVNKQNDRVYLPRRSVENLHLRLATRTQAPAMRHNS